MQEDRKPRRAPAQPAPWSPSAYDPRAHAGRLHGPLPGHPAPAAAVPPISSPRLPLPPRQQPHQYQQPGAPYPQPQQPWQYAPPPPVQVLVQQNAYWPSRAVTRQGLGPLWTIFHLAMTFMTAGLWALVWWWHYRSRRSVTTFR
jgi:hypothetical protein